MTIEEFAKGMVFLFVGKDRPVEKNTIEVYFELLGHLDYKIFHAACANVLMTHKYATFPSIAELNEAVQRLSPRAMSGGEAYAIAREAALRIDPDLRGTYRVYVGDGKYKEYSSQAAHVFERLKVPAAIVKAIETYGLHELCLPDSPDGVMRAQFAKIFETAQEREQRTAALPPSVRQMLGEKSDGELIKASLAAIGGMLK